MRNIRKRASFFAVVFLSSTVFSIAFAQNGVDPRLIQKCNSGDGKSCAFVGALMFRQNEKIARQYYQKACDAGHTSSCVFSGGTSVGDVKLPALPNTVGADNGQADENTKAGALLWYNKYLKQFMEECNETTEPREGQVRSKMWICITDTKKEGNVVNHFWRFGERCDVDGISRLTTHSPKKQTIDNHFKIRSAGDASTFICTSDLDLNDAGKVTSQKLKNCSVLNAQGSEILKFEGFYNYSESTGEKSGGQLTFLSFRGKSIRIDNPIYSCESNDKY